MIEKFPNRSPGWGVWGRRGAEATPPSQRLAPGKTVPCVSPGPCKGASCPTDDTEKSTQLTPSKRLQEATSGLHTNPRGRYHSCTISDADPGVGAHTDRAAERLFLQFKHASIASTCDAARPPPAAPTPSSTPGRSTHSPLGHRAGLLEPQITASGTRQATVGLVRAKVSGASEQTKTLLSPPRKCQNLPPFSLKCVHVHAPPTLAHPPKQ